ITSRGLKGFMTAETFPIMSSRQVHSNNSAVDLVELAIRRGEGHFSAAGALAVETGAHTGRSAQDKFTVRDSETDGEVWWDNNKPLEPHHFETLYRDFLEYSKGRELFVQDLFAGADPKRQLATRIVCEYAWHALFIRHLLRRPGPGDLEHFTPGLTI